MEAILLRNLPEGVGEVYVWKKYSIQENVSYTWNRWSVVETVTYKWNKWNANESASDRYTYLPTGQRGTIYVNLDSFGLIPGYKGTTANTSTKRFTGTNPIQVQDSDVYSKLNGNFIFPGSASSGPIAYISNGESDHGSPVGLQYISYREFVTTYSKGSTSYGQVTSTSSSAYPSNGASGSYWYESAGSDTTYSKGSTSYPDVSSTSDSAYPNSGHQDGYWYENRQQIITHSMGSYIEDVFSTNPKRYPENGIDGSYWYVLQS